MNRMSEDECREFMRAGTRTGKVATTRRDGRPHVTPAWFVLEGDELIFMTHETSIRGRALQTEPRVMISVDEEVFPYAFVHAEGVAHCDRLSPVELLPWSLRIAERYVPTDRAQSTGERNAVEGELLVRVDVTRWVGMRDVAA